MHSIVEINKLKNYILPNGVYSNIRANSRCVHAHFPDIYDKIKDNYHTKLYMLLYGINDIPICKNLNCENKVKLENIGAGFRSYCSRKCLSEHQKTDKLFAEKIRQTHLRNSPLKEKYPDLNIKLDSSNRNYFLINDYCEHGEIKLYSSTFQKLYNSKTNLCQKCKDEIFENYIPKNDDIIKFYETFEDFYLKNRYLFNEKWFKRFYPKEYKIILMWSEHLKNVSLSEAIYLFKNKMKNRPLCTNCEKNETHFNYSSLSYTNFCNSYACIKNTSIGEIHIYEYISSIYNAQHKFYLNKNEFDIYVKDKKLAIEFNGLYWHGEKNQTNKNYHYEKWKLCNDNGIKLITIWEDDWNNKQDLVKSMLRNQLGLNENKIYARKTKIKEIFYNDTKQFLKDNHIQGNCQSSIRLGLYYENELVSLMTFGKRNIGKKTQFELLRFCNKQNTSVAGGASKLFKHFVDNYNPFKVVSYANLDISDGSLYETLGFENKGHTGVNYWWVKDKQKFHRNNFMKHKLVSKGSDINKTADEIMRERGYYKIYGNGNLKYE